MGMPSLLLNRLTRDGKLILAARMIRAFSYGFLSIVLAIYLKFIGFNDVIIGFVLTATLVNSVVFTLFASFYADRIGRRKILMIFAALLSISGTIFLVTENYVALIIAALIETINVTGTETGAFLSIEQALLPQTVKDTKKRNTIFALYNMAGTFAMSAGILLSGVLTAFSFLAASKIADRIGLVNTMVFTHVPSNILLILAAFAPTLPLAIAFYLGRMALSQMDVPTRQSYIVAVVKEEERTASTGITNISRNISQAVSPSLTGYILQALPVLSAPFVFGGILKIAYDLALYLNFKNIKPAEEETGKRD